MSTGRLTPSPEQETAIQRMVAEPTRAVLNASTMGTGKTLCAVEVALRIGARTVLVVAPPNTRLGWEATFARQGCELPFKWLNSTVKGLGNLSDYEFGVEGVYFVGTELFARWWKKRRDSGDQLWARGVDLVVMDETHRAQSRKSLTYRALQNTSASFRMAMSGTPGGNSFDGLWGTVRWLWPDLSGVGAVADKSYYRWVDRWCETKFDRFVYGGKKVVGEKNPGEFVNSLPCYIRLDPPVGVGVVEETRLVGLGVKQRKAYDSLQNNLIAWLDSGVLVVDAGNMVYGRLRQAALALPMVRDDGVVDFDVDAPSAKLDELRLIVADELDGESALFLTDSQKFAVVVEARVRSWGFAVERWDGTVSQGKREGIKGRFVSGETRFVVAVVSAISEGVDGFQHATRNVVWLSKHGSGLHNEQALARVLRRGQVDVVRSFVLEAVDTVDSGQFSKLMLAALARHAELAVAS